MSVERQRNDGVARFWPWLAAPTALVIAIAGSSCLERRDIERKGERDGCTACHGDASRAGSALAKSAPPFDLLGSREASYPGVGAHALHLQAGTTHGAVACQECHVVPEHANSPGHADDALPAEISFGRLARHHDHDPRYDPIARSCDNSYCHGAVSTAVWTEPRDSDKACGSCHGLPPAAPHPASTACFNCHGEVVDAQRRIVAPDLHVNGVVELRAETCSQCHGREDDPAPPFDTLGNTSRAALGVGAHSVHLTGGESSRPVACVECHQVPSSPDDFAHADGLPAEVALSGIAEVGGREPRWERTSQRCVDGWCHSPGPSAKGSSPRWTSAQSSSCSGCHGEPPPAPHPQMRDCSRCHGQVVAPNDASIASPARHVDGKIDVDIDEGCSSCHGAQNPAPPSALSGATATSEPSVGAHQIHLAGTERSRAVACAECHAVPARVLDPGHVDSFLPAEVAFTGPSVAFGAAPAYADGKCANTACHGGAFPHGHASGGTLTAPRWTIVDGTQAACGTCHALPPPRPHPYYSEDCGRCHKNMSPDGSEFVRPDLHVDGVVTFDL